MALMNLFLGKEWRHRCRERACGHRVGDREWNEWTKMWYIYTKKYYSTIKRNEFESVLVRGMKLEPVTQREVSQKKKTNSVY